MLKFTAFVATLTLAGSTAALAAASSGSNASTMASPPPLAQHSHAYHQANTASPIVTGPIRHMQATRQPAQNAPAMKQASTGMNGTPAVNPGMSGPDYGSSTLMSRLNAVSTRVHLARRSGKLTRSEYQQLHSDYAQVHSNIARAHDRFGQEIPNRRLWALNGQIRYLSNEASKLIG